MQMDTGEIFRRYKNMLGAEIHKITILAELNDCSPREIKKILEAEKEKEENLVVECSGGYHPDDNPYCRIETKAATREGLCKEDIDTWISKMIFAKIDILDAEIIKLEKELEARKEEYAKLVKLL